jgi:hypothetical protein
MKPKQNELNDERRRTTRHPLQFWLLPLLMVMVLAGCKQDAKVAADTKDAKVAADTNPAGTYALVSVDGNKVPCTVQHEGHTLGVKSGSFIINPDGTCSSKVVFSPPSGGDATREVKATYTREGPKLTMKWEGAGMTTGTVEGDTFTMNNEGMVFAYHK